ncbi:chlorite dismutase family protein [Methylocucumis oryzae]|uniref:Chlorite dismutase n=1 Tax=Methylocucumis oryzae TaxID=1632867 RepID=A0A0F3IHY9_9GAMM|nr:chlorite dismutase family protein [Methylocucumis oryzae]KJV06282.1 chlorite dismutase [Methylocucumis oryzae]
MSTRFFQFVGGDTGVWRVVKTHTLIGEPLLDVARLDVVAGQDNASQPDSGWLLRGITSNERYVERAEKNTLVEKQQGLGRPEATCAALIPIRKNAAWWALTQDERRHIFEGQSQHIQIGLDYLPAIARRLHHCRDISENEPFDFLTWFEFAPTDEEAFNQMLMQLRASEEWQYIDREVDIRLVREA